MSLSSRTAEIAGVVLGINPSLICGIRCPGLAEMGGLPPKSDLNYASNWTCGLVTDSCERGERGSPPNSGILRTDRGTRIFTHVDWLKLWKNLNWHKLGGIAVAEGRQSTRRMLIFASVEPKKFARN